MNKKMKFWSIVFLTINSIIGTGIFLSPGGVTKQAGSMAPFIYLCAAVFAAVLAVTFAAASKYVVKNTIDQNFIFLFIGSLPYKSCK